MNTQAVGNVTFYASCMQGDVRPGFIADKIQMAGSSIEGLGHIFMWAGDMFTKYGWSGAILSVFGYGIGKTAELRGGGDAITNLAWNRLIETSGALGVGLGLSAIGGPASYAGSFLASKETQCSIGEKLTFNFKSPKEEI